MIRKSIFAVAVAASLPFSASAAEMSAQDFAAKAAQSDMFEIEAAPFTLPLRNPLARAEPANATVKVL